MPPKAPRLTAKEIVSALENLGFAFSWQSGSHRIYKNREGKRVTVPFHAGEVLHPKILKSILKDAGVSRERLEELL